MNGLKALLSGLFICIFFIASPQNEKIDSLQVVIQNAQEDTLKVKALLSLAESELRIDNQLALKYANDAKELADKLNFSYGKAYALKNMGNASYYLGNYMEALFYWQQSLAIFKQSGDLLGVSNMQSNMGVVYYYQGDDEQALKYYLESLKAAEKIDNKLRIATAKVNIGAVYFQKENTHDLALKYYLEALPLSEELNDQEAIGTVYVNLGEIYLTKGDDVSALNYFEKGLEAYQSVNGNTPYALYDLGRLYLFRKDYERALSYQKEAFDLAGQKNSKNEMAQASIGIAETYREMGKIREAIQAYKQSLEISSEVNANYLMKSAYQGLAELYEKSADYTDAYKYLTLYTAIKDTLYNAEMDKKMQNMSLQFDLEKKQGEIDLLEKDKLQKIQESRNQQLWTFSVSGALISALVLSFVLYRSVRTKQRSNSQLKAQKEEVQETLEKLRATQSQLIQSEKMASLGELTAGIAHEIQNPLNFVNNFSEVSYELLDEMKEEVEAGNLETVLEIASDLKGNLQKINQHGKRADSIVKGMLQHSRTGSGTKEAVNINMMADEYLRLTFHGLAVKDSGFKAELNTDFDENVGEVMVIPQDLGRVILNILTNAFYAVNDKRKKETDDYKPTVSISTKKLKDNVVIQIADNGNGIPSGILSKIFQPFFTTKPTGEGTGLGLSLSYDIITKGYGGELKVDTKEGEGTTFSIYLPA